MEKRNRPRPGETSRSRPPSRPSTRTGSRLSSRPSSRQPSRPPSTISFALSHQERIDECPSSRIRIKSAGYDARARRTHSTVICPSPRYGRESVQSRSGRRSVQSQSGRRSVQSRSGSRAGNSCLAPSGGKNNENRTSKVRISTIPSKMAVPKKEKSIEERKSVISGRDSRLSVRQSYMERTSLLKLGGPVLKAPSNSVRRESSLGRRKSMAPAKDKTEKESTDEKSENKTRRWVPDTDKHLPGKPFGWKIYQDSDSTKCQIWKVPLATLNYMPIMYKNHLQSQKQLYPTNYKTYDKDFKFYCPTCKEYFKTITEAHKHLLHTDKLRKVKQMFAMQVLIQQQEEEIAEIKAIKAIKKKKKRNSVKRKSTEENEMQEIGEMGEDENRGSGMYPYQRSEEVDSTLYPSAGQIASLPVNNHGRTRGARESMKETISRSRMILNRSQQRLLDLRARQLKSEICIT